MNLNFVTELFNNQRLVVVGVVSLIGYTIVVNLTERIGGMSSKAIIVRELNRDSWSVVGKKTHLQILAEDVPTLVKEMRISFKSGISRPLSKRREQLKALRKIFTEHRNEINDALHKDLSRPRVEASIYDYHGPIHEIDGLLKNLGKWSADEHGSFIDALTFPSSAKIVKEPYGLSLIINTWNFPFMLAIVPLAGAIAAGNVCILQVNTLANNSARLLGRLIEKYMDPAIVTVVGLGFKDDYEATATLIKERHDHIFFTGSSVGGKVIAKAAAEFLTPIVLELGGKSPVFVDGTMDAYTTAKRLVLGRCLNAGQQCVAPDYCLITEKALEELKPNIVKVIQEFYGGTDEAAMAGQFGTIINDKYFDRLAAMIDKVDKSDVIVGGHYNKKTRYIAPTFATCSFDHVLMEQEIFGPILAFVIVQDVDEAITYINKREKPLALYLFSDDKSVVDKIVYNTSSGGITINATIYHAGHADMPFGGVGASGQGTYHGKYTFDCFSHRKPVVKKMQAPIIGDPFYMYPPWTDVKGKILDFAYKYLI